MNFKLTFSCLLVISFFISCNSDELNTDDKVITNNETNFEKVLEQKFSEVNAKKIEIENELISEFFKDIDTTKLIINNNRTISEEIKINAVKNYHEKKLTKIDKLVREINFKSIQSIAEEINSLMVVDSKRAEEIYEKNKAFFIRNEFGVTPIVDYKLANIIDVDNNIFGLNSNIYSLNNTNNGVTPSIKEGILVSNNDYAVTWHARYYHKQGISLKLYENETRIGTYLKMNGAYAYYPSVISFNQSGYYFGSSNQVDTNYLDFAPGTWVSTTLNSQSTYLSFSVLLGGNINGVFATIVNNQLVQLQYNNSI